MKIFYLFFLGFLYLPSESDYINAPSAFLDSIAISAKPENIKYQIAAVYKEDKYTLTVLRIPQILTLEEVKEQLIFYYAMLNNKQEREYEKISVFPLFANLGGQAAIKCRYKNDQLRFSNTKWKHIQVPDPPLPEEKDIFNRLMEYYFKKTQNYGEIPDQSIRKFCTEKNENYEKVKMTYQKIILWQYSTY